MTEEMSILDKRPAGFWIRFLAINLDYLIMIPVTVIPAWFAYKNSNFALLLMSSFIWIIYKPLMEAKLGATCGKMICRIRVENEKGNNITLLQTYIRFLPFMLNSVVLLVLAYLLFHNPSFSTTTDKIQRSLVMQQLHFRTISNITALVICIDCLFAAFTQKKRALHDMIAKSVCVYKKQAAEPKKERRTCASCNTEYYLEDYSPNVEHIYCTNCKAELPRNSIQ